MIEKNGLLEKVFMILNFKDMKAHIVRHSLHNTRTICFYTEIKKNHTHPDFDKAEFKGNAIVDYHPVYHWELELEDKELRIYDTQEDREVKRLGYLVPSKGWAGSLYVSLF